MFTKITEEATIHSITMITAEIISPVEPLLIIDLYFIFTFKTSPLVIIIFD